MQSNPRYLSVSAGSLLVGLCAEIRFKDLKIKLEIVRSGKDVQYTPMIVQILSLITPNIFFCTPV